MANRSNHTLHKNGSKTSVSQYRPISNLDSLGKHYFGKSKVGNEKFARVPAKEVSQILTVYSMKPNQYIYTVGMF